MKSFMILLVLFVFTLFSMAGCGAAPNEKPLPPEHEPTVYGIVEIEDWSGMKATTSFSNVTATFFDEDAQKIANLLNGSELTKEFPALDPDWTITLYTDEWEISIQDGNCISACYGNTEGAFSYDESRATQLLAILEGYGLLPGDGPEPPETEIQTVGTIQMEKGGSFRVTCAYPEESSAVLNETDSSEIVSLLNDKELINEFSACDSDLTLKYGDWTFIIHTSCGSVGAYHGELEGSCELSDADLSALRGILAEYEINTEG